MAISDSFSFVTGDDMWRSLKEIKICGGPKWAEKPLFLYIFGLRRTGQP